MKDQYLYWFKEINKIPRCSGHEEAVVRFLEKKCKDKGLEVKVDKHFNIVIKKGGTKGYENAPSIILQGHTDMVCEKNKGTKHDFLKDPITMIEKDGILTADGTTLGADNGVAVAYIMAILFDDSIAHPPLEALFTSEEEVGLVGAKAFDNDFFNLKSKMMINLDSGREGVLIVGCAGGTQIVLKTPIEKMGLPSGFTCLKLSLGGFKGGHSGVDIQKGLGNSNVVLARYLSEVQKKMPIHMTSFHSGGKLNAIPREGEMILAVQDSEKTKNILGDFSITLREEFRDVDDEFVLDVSEVEGIQEVYTTKLTQKILTSLMILPCGVRSMSPHLPTFVDLSCSIGSIKEVSDKIKIIMFARSGVDSKKEKLIESVRQYASSMDMDFTRDLDFLSWKYEPKSKLREISQKVYQDLYSKEPIIKPSQGGLECGILLNKLGGDVDIIAMAPNTHGAHTPDESLELSSFKRVYDYLTKILEALK